MSYSCQGGREEPTLLFLGWQIGGAIKSDNNEDKNIKERYSCCDISWTNNKVRHIGIC